MHKAEIDGRQQVSISSDRMNRAFLGGSAILTYHRIVPPEERRLDGAVLIQTPFEVKFTKREWLSAWSRGIFSVTFISTLVTETYFPFALALGPLLYLGYRQLAN